MRAESLYLDHLVTTQSVTNLDIALEDAHQTSLEALLATAAREAAAHHRACRGHLSASAVSSCTRKCADGR